MKTRIIFIITITTLIVVNLPIINTQILAKTDGDHFRYSNADASFTYTQTFDILQPFISDYTIERFNNQTRPSPENKEVFRIYKINPLYFWRWRYYIGVSRKFKYKSWEEIEPNRTPRIPDNMWQKF